MRLRPRQEVFVNHSITALDGYGNTIGVAPTGAGKTVMLSSVTGHYVKHGAKALIIQHRDELVAQNDATYRKVNPDQRTGFYTAKLKEWHHPVTFAMIQTLSLEQNLKTLPRHDIAVIDEGHHAAADSYLRTIDALRSANPDLRLYLVTATPNRGDKKALRGIVDNVADQITLKELVDTGFLVKPRTFVIDIGVREELSGVRKLAADFDMSAVEAIMDKQVLNDRIVSEWAGVAGDRQSVVFCSTVAHAKHVAETFRSAGIRAATVEGNMPEADRKATLKAYAAGEIQLLTNVAVLTEGWDDQPTSCIVLLRPSSFKSTMIQMIGRGLRKVDPERHPGVIKDDCIVLDFGTSVLMHGSIEQDVNLDQKGTKDCPSCAAKLPAQARECAICGYEFPREDPAETGQLTPIGEGEGGKVKGNLESFVLTEVDLLAKSPYRYETLFDGMVSIANALDAWACVVFYYGRWHAIGGAEKGGGIRHVADTHDRLMALAAADDFLREHGDQDAAGKTKRWLSQSPSDKQLEHLRLSPMLAIGMTKYEASCRLTWRWSERAIRGILERSYRAAA